MSMLCSPNSRCGNSSRHSLYQASKRAFAQRERASAAIDRRAQWRGSAAARSGEIRQPGPGQPGAQATGGRGQAGEDWHGRIRQSSAWADFRHTDGSPAAGRVGRRNFRSAGHPLAVGGSAAAIQRAAHHPGALAHHVRHRQAAHQPPPADRQASGGV